MCLYTINKEWLIMLANHCVEVCDDGSGGGTVDYSTLLSMREVLNQESTD